MNRLFDTIVLLFNGNSLYLSLIIIFNSILITIFPLIMVYNYIRQQIKKDFLLVSITLFGLLSMGYFGIIIMFYIMVIGNIIYGNFLKMIYEFKFIYFQTGLLLFYLFSIIIFSFRIDIRNSNYIKIMWLFFNIRNICHKDIIYLNTFRVVRSLQEKEFLVLKYSQDGIIYQKIYFITNIMYLINLIRKKNTDIKYGKVLGQNIMIDDMINKK
jgi:hypothetical protein